MWYIYYTRTQVIFTNGYGKGWTMRKEAYDWAEDNGYDLTEILVVPGIDITE